MSWKQKFDNSKDGDVPMFPFYFRIHDLCEIKDLAFIEGNIPKAFRTLRTIFENCIWRFRKKGEAYEEEQEQEFIVALDECQVVYNKYVFSKNEKSKFSFMEDFQDQYCKANVILMDLLAVWGILIPEEIEDVIGIIKARNEKHFAKKDQEETVKFEDG